MKKIILFILTLSMLCTVVPCGALGYSDVTDLEAVDVITGIGIMEGYSDGTFLPDNNITRAEFADVVAGIYTYGSENDGTSEWKSKYFTDIYSGTELIPLEEMQKDEVGIFSDVPQSSWAYNSIKLVSELGFMEGVGGGRFGADDNLTIEQALKVIVTMMGYRFEADKKGGYPSGYVTVAGELGLTDSVGESSAYAKRKDIAQIVYDAFDVEVVQNVRENGKWGQRTKEGETFLLKVVGLSSGRGRMTDNGYTNLLSSKVPVLNQVVINNKNFTLNTNGEMFRSLLGRDVDYYYYTTDDGENILVYARLSGQDTVYEIDIEDFKDYSNNKIYYSDDTRDREISLVKAPYFIKNKTAVKDFDKTDFDCNYGKITVVKSRGSSDADLIILQSYQNFNIEYVDVAAEVMYSMMEFMRELQWQCYNKHQLTCYNMGDILVYKYGVETQPKPDETPLVYFAANVPVTNFDCDRDEFVGSYRSEENPQRVESGECSNSTLYGGDPCFALQLDIDLKANEEKEINIFLGTAMTEEEIKNCVSHCREDNFVEKSFAKLYEHWDNYLNKFQCEIPDKDAETMINIWNPYQAERNFQFSRNISYYATGTFRGVGVRDTAQDILSMVSFDTRRAKDKLNLLFTQQYQDGHCNHYCFPNEGWEPVTRIHSDNHLWLVMTAYNIIMEEGKLDYLDEVVDFYDGGSATVWEHIQKSIDFCMANLGENGFPLMLSSDWNDMLYKVCREGKGESIWTSMQLGTVLPMIAEIAELKGESGQKYLDIYEQQKKLINEIAWDGNWFIRCITDNGTYIGSEKEPQAKIWLNSQSWSVISKMGDADKQRKAMDNVNKYLDTDLGVKKIHPSMTTDYPSKDGNLTMYNKGCGENGSVFCHANTWAIIAECMLGNADRAYKYYHQLLPMIAQAKAGEWRYKAEPYVYASNIFGPESDKFGLANVSWLTGTAAWMYIAVTQHMLGIKAKWNGLEINPCLSKEMLPAKVTRVFRGCKYDITITKNEKMFIEHVDGRKEYKI